ncbi:hypothetical protein D3C78_1944040 [compost metagenome]
MRASGHLIALVEQVCQLVGFFSCAIEHAFEQVVIRCDYLPEALEGRRVGDVEQVQ